MVYMMNENKFYAKLVTVFTMFLYFLSFYSIVLGEGSLAGLLFFIALLCTVGLAIIIFLSISMVE